MVTFSRPLGLDPESLERLSEADLMSLAEHLDVELKTRSGQERDTLFGLLMTTIQVLLRNADRPSGQREAMLRGALYVLLLEFPPMVLQKVLLMHIGASPILQADEKHHLVATLGAVCFDSLLGQYTQRRDIIAGHTALDVLEECLRITRRVVEGVEDDGEGVAGERPAAH